MGSSQKPQRPFVLLDDARESGGDGAHAANARVYRAPVEVFAAYRPADVERALAEAEAARVAKSAVIIKDHLSENGLDYLTLRVMDWSQSRLGA